MTRVNVPPVDGDAGGWFEIRPLGFLSPDHQDDDDDLVDALRDRKRAALPPPGPDPLNPVVMAEEPVITLGRKDLAPRFGLLLGLVLEGSSYGIDTARLAAAVAMAPGDARVDALGTAFTEERRKLPLHAWNTLRQKLEPYFGALNGQGPKGTQPPDGTTSPTSPAT
jgi:hypothetical protein